MVLLPQLYYHSLEIFDCRYNAAKSSLSFAMLPNAWSN